MGTNKLEGNWVRIKNLDKMYNTYMSNYEPDNTLVNVFGNGKMLKIDFSSMATACEHISFLTAGSASKNPICNDWNHNRFSIRRKPTWEYEIEPNKWVPADDPRIDYFYEFEFKLGKYSPGLVYHCFGDENSTGIDFENMMVFCNSSHKNTQLRCPTQNHNKFKLRKIVR